jgi:hypothetical protein
VNDTSSTAFHQLRDSVQRNCHLADAEHARDYSLCIYLLKMREYYRRLAATYDQWLRGGALGEFRDLIPGARAHWQSIAEKMLAIFDEGPEDPGTVIDALIGERARY